MNDKQEVIESPLHGYSINKNKRWEMLDDDSIGKLYYADAQNTFRMRRREDFEIWEERGDGNLVKFVEGESSDQHSGGRQARKQKRQEEAKQRKNGIPTHRTRTRSEEGDAETSSYASDPKPRILLVGTNSQDRFRSIAVCKNCGKSLYVGCRSTTKEARKKEIFSCIRAEVA
eukprot:TRINITY_DN1279_c0_g1_i1.p1 TRINITY_DN1279_c0_g1~~TRINITY_DN1279_c0_g1_i1.p1  ORF type:complete len:173 (-),score=38.42 TRINITY_DN1279_c0_g1_i1:126-644(-)